MSLRILYDEFAGEVQSNGQAINIVAWMLFTFY